MEKYFHLITVDIIGNILKSYSYTKKTNNWI